MPLVIDASMATAWVIADERTADTDAMLAQTRREGAHAPDLFWHEVRNILLKTERQGRAASGSADVSIDILRRLPISIAAPRDDAAILNLSRTRNLSAYGAAYLAVAVESGLPLATLGRALAAAARACRVALLGPLAP